MILEQVANWLSFRKAWTDICCSQHEWFLLVEDDVKFTHRAAHCWNTLVTPELLEDCSGEPCMIRCGWQLGEEYIDEAEPELLEGVVRMSNHCSVLNRSMARELLAGSDEHIYATSDVYAHEIVATQFRNFTMFPPISYDLSFALKVPSLIRPKGIHLDDPIHTALVRKAVRLEPDQIEVWLRSLVWVRGDVQAGQRAAVAANLSGAVVGWHRLRRASAGTDVVVVALDVPPVWVYAVYRFFVGEAVHRPRDFRLVDLDWLREVDLEFPI